MKNKLWKYSFTAILWAIIFCNFCNAQTTRQQILDLQKNIGKEKLIEKFVTIFGDGISTCMPVNISSDYFKGKAIIDGEGLFSYYKYEILDSIESQKMDMEDYYKFATNLLLKNDTIHLGSRKLYDNKLGWEFQTFPIIDSIINYPKDKQAKLINSAFDENGMMKVDPVSNTYLYQPGSLILKLFEWGILIIDAEDLPAYFLFYHSMLDELKKLGQQPSDMINDCLTTFIDHISDAKELYLLTDYYPYNFEFRDFETNKKNINYISIEEMRNSENIKLLENGIRVIFYEGMILDKDSLLFKFSESDMIMRNEKQLKRIMPINSAEYFFQYSPETQDWNFTEVKYSK